MAQGAPVNLDKVWLENFLRRDVQGFSEEIRKIQGDGPTVPALSSLLPEGDHPDGVLAGAVLPLTIGGMTKDGVTNGQRLNKAVVDMITDVTTILDEQKTLFTSIEDSLETTIEKLFKTQGENLEKIDGQKLLDIFSDVDDVLGGGDGEDD
ncbi:MULTISPECIES: type VII secretion system-associated protein [unclassified Streptomyces]|uniref:type VII secretion system-associated protein n=1 Tax=unclassified Streptomyces TaxID=2593676 RepID=UPI00093FD364|nr:type VII secretion system-associated protein [Streptomyces sp. CB02058]OKI91487.1 hypothetical protein AMK10_26045 [Streptomyces sp. CB02058]